MNLPVGGSDILLKNEKKIKFNSDELNELVYTKFAWIFIFIAICDILYSCFNCSSPAMEADKQCKCAALLIVGIGAVLNFLKLKLIKNGMLFSSNRLYFIVKCLEIAVATAGGILSCRTWLLVLIVFPIFMATITKGIRVGLMLVINYVIFFTCIGLLNKGPEGFLHSTDFYFYCLIIAIIFLFIIMCGMINRRIQGNQAEKEKLLLEIEEKYKQLNIAQKEIESNYEMLKESNIKLEDSNKKLTETVAEFYTLQQITQAISSIFDIKELLKFINDVIIGVMGVNYSTIAIHDPKKNRLNVQTTNITNPAELAILSDNINCSVLREVLSSGNAVMDNFTDPKQFVFTRDREINSIICIPLYTKSRKFGLVLLEQKHSNAFDEDNLRFLKTIGQQVGIAFENAELYHKMEELATIDGLTGVYNRLYFQERLEKEFVEAKAGNYTLSLAIFDIDHFKKFNDTYGHLFGDKVLKYITGLVMGMLRKSDIMARFGGEEFIFLFPHTSMEEALDKVEKIRQKVEKAQIMDNLVTAHVTVSFGVSCFPQAALTGNELIKTADDALYEAKADGRNCVRSARVM